MSDELKPCPFCGSCGMIAATLDDMWRPMCVVDGCCALDGYVTRPKAIEAWNTRHRTQHGAQSEPVACCQQMSGGMWIDGKHIGQHCPVHSPTTAEQLAEAQREIARLREALANPPEHKYWGAGEPDCPREIKCGNGELHTLRCKVCGEDSPRNPICQGGL